ncbi:MAG: hypothetical protein IRY83_04030 [Chloroflexi bacterium]|nr:hypothetical protein [Chloroflexota bacterium]
MTPDNRSLRRLEWRCQCGTVLAVETNNSLHDGDLLLLIRLHANGCADARRWTEIVDAEAVKDREYRKRAEALAAMVRVPNRSQFARFLYEIRAESLEQARDYLAQHSYLDIREVMRRESGFGPRVVIAWRQAIGLDGGG